MNSVASALQLYRQGSVREAEAVCAALLAHNVSPADCLALLADIRQSTGRYAEAAAALSALSLLTPNDAATLRRWGAALISAGRASEAVAPLGRAVELEPRNVRAHNNLGQALLNTGDIDGAIREFEQALALDPQYAVGYSNLGMALSQAGRFEDAVATLQRAVALDASLVVARLNLGAGLEKRGSLPEALSVYEDLVNSSPEFVDAWIARGALLLTLKGAGAALESFDAALRRRSADATAHVGRASALLQLQRPAEALQAAEFALRAREDFPAALDAKAAALLQLNRAVEARLALETALALSPSYVEGWCDLAVVHQYLGEDSAAVDSLARALKTDPDCALARGAMLAAQIPSIADSEEQSVAARLAFVRELDAFDAWVRARALPASDSWTLARQPFFYLSYQEESNRPLLERYRRASAARVKHFAARPAPHPGGGENGRFKLGVVSSQIYDHSVFNALTRGWLFGLDSRRIEISVFSLATKSDSCTDTARAAVEHFESGNRGSAEWADCIARRGLDAIIYPEIGIDRATLALAHLRLAPRQLAAWGHPETSGLPTIDEFLSAAAFEPDQAQDHYSERLVVLPYLGVSYQPVDTDPTPVDLERLGIANDGPLLICPGAPFKYRPADDEVWVAIALRLRRCTFAFFLHERVELSHKLQRRLTAAFARAGLDAMNFVVFLPWLPRNAFLGLLLRADVYLDTLGFSGFNTFMLAVQAHLPCVSLEGRFMRGRFGSGILRHLGLANLVAASPAQYVEIAVALAEDSVHREHIRALLRAREARAYRETRAVESLMRLLLS